jgi:endonuclease/exonuclease/phosphatase (EEP) superfamily protein YafD
MLRIGSMILGGFVIAVTILPFFRSKAWWVRIWDFPRFQLAILGALAFAGVTLTGARAPSSLTWILSGVTGAAVLYQAGFVWRYSRLAPLEVQPSQRTDRPRLAVAVSNVLQTNRDADRLIRVLTGADADLMLFVETDD